jgi:hypothetical protein
MEERIIQYCDSKEVPIESVLSLYRANDWSSANKPDQQHQGLLHSDSLVTAWEGERLVGLANAISDRFSVVYYFRISRFGASHGSVAKTVISAERNTTLLSELHRKKRESTAINEV